MSINHYTVSTFCKLLQFSLTNENIVIEIVRLSSKMTVPLVISNNSVDPKRMAKVHR